MYNNGILPNLQVHLILKKHVRNKINISAFKDFERWKYFPYQIYETLSAA